MSIITLRVLGVDKVFLGGDVALGPQSADNALVVGLQGIPVSNAQPNNSDVLTYDSGLGEWRPEPGGGGAVAEPLFQIVYGTGPSVSSSDHAIYDFNVFQQTNSIQNINQTNVWPGTGDPGTNTVALALANTANSSVGQPIQYSPNLLFLSHYRRTANNADAIWRTGWQLQPEVNDNAFLSLFGSQNSHLPIRQIDIEMDGLLGATTMTVYGNQDISTATAPFVGLCLANTGATGAGELFQQRSPMLRLQGHQFNGSAQISAASLQVRPFSGTSNFSLDFYNSTAGVNGLLMGWFPQTPALGSGTTGFASAAAQDISIEAGSLTNDGSVLPNGWYANHLGNSNNAGLVAAMLSSQKEFQFRASALQDGTTPIAMVPRVDSTYWLGANGLRWNSVFSAWHDTKEGAQLTAAATITPTSGLHHITGATAVTTIATTNLPSGGNVFLTLIADSATITFNTGGNIGASATLSQGQSITFVWDNTATTWYPIPTGASVSQPNNQIVTGTGSGVTSSANLTYNGTLLQETLNAVGTAQTVGVSFQNTTAATSGAANQQFSPMLQLIGRQFNGASQACGLDLQVRPFTGTNNFSCDFYSDVAGSKSRLMGWMPATPNQAVVGFATQSGQPFAIECGTLANDGSVNGNGLLINASSNANGKFSVLLSGFQEFQFRTSATQDGVTPVGLVPRVDATYWLGSNLLRMKSIWSAWHDTKLGAQLTAASTITPTTGAHHVTGATTIDTIAITNIPTSGNVELILIADGGTITVSSAGNVAVAFTIAQNKAQKLYYDNAGGLWYPLQGA